MSDTANFVHLHNHTEYSFLDGAMKIKEMVARAVEQKSPAIAITDHGGLFGAMEFYSAAKYAGIKPLLGFEAYVTRGDRTERKQVPRHHLVLLAKNNVGWKNIMKLSSAGYLDGFYYKPRIDMALLRNHSEGIIATSACIGGAIQQALLKGRRDEAISLTDEYLEIFGEGNFFYELQDHGIEDERIIMPQMIDIAREKGVPMIVANDAHYLNQSDHEAHAVLLCMQTNNKMSDPNRYQFTGDQFYLKTPAEMALLFPQVPEAMDNTVRIAEMCDDVNPKHKAAMPSVAVPKKYEGLSESEYLRTLAYEGARKIYGAVLSQEVEERLAYELEVVISMGFSGYYLIVMDFLKKADEMGIMRGVRGSAAGSLVGYCIGISNVCPLKYDLLFERFLNPERASMPDVDADLADADRDRVIQYCVETYGRDAVSQIINFGRMMAKAAVKDVARVLDVSVSESQRLSNMVEEKTIAESIAANKELAEELKKNSLYAQVFDYAQRLEGMARQPGMHAAGVIIAPGDITNWAPLFKQTGENGAVMTQFDMKYIEDTGMIKMDFLGLRTLSVLQNALRMIRENHGITLDLWHDIQDGDELTYREIFHKGNTVEIFQFESPGMRKHLKKLQARGIEDLIAMTSLYRPGPMENIDSFIARRHGKEEIKYPHPLIKEILDVTYGVVVYQEQVMRIAQKMGGFTLGKADELRKVMGKKLVDKLPPLKELFMKGAMEREIEPAIAEEVWALMAEFAKYGFNKAHACVYAHVSYQSAYLKAHYPHEYMAAVISSRMGDTSRFVIATEEARRMGIDVIPPDINFSQLDCGVHEGKITIGLGAIANVGKAALEILRVREERDGEPFVDIYDLCSSINLRDVSKKALESLIYAGALDTLKGSRAQNFMAIDAAVEYGKRQSSERELGQISLFGGDEMMSLPKPEMPEVREWDFFEKLSHEKEVLNFYVSGHPLEAYRDELQACVNLWLSAEDITTVRPAVRPERGRPQYESRVVGGMISQVKKSISKKDGRPFAFLTLEDFYGTAEVILWPDMYEKMVDYCAVDNMVLIRGGVDVEVGDEVEQGEGPKRVLKVFPEKIIPLEEVRDTFIHCVKISMNTETLTDEGLQTLYKTLDRHKGGCEVVLKVLSQSGTEHAMVAKGVKVNCKPQTLEALRGLPLVDEVQLSQLKSAS